MRRWAAVVVLAMLTIVGCSAGEKEPPADSEFVGKWLPVAEETKGAIEGISAAVEFKRDGTYELINECHTVKGKWSIRSDRSVAFDPKSESQEHCAAMLGFDPDSATVAGNLLTVTSDDESTWSGHMKREE